MFVLISVWTKVDDKPTFPHLELNVAKKHANTEVILMIG